MAQAREDDEDEVGSTNEQEEGRAHLAETMVSNGVERPSHTVEENNKTSLQGEALGSASRPFAVQHSSSAALQAIQT